MENTKVKKIKKQIYASISEELLKEIEDMAKAEQRSLANIASIIIEKGWEIYLKEKSK